jgi:hypothetical protein
MPNFDRRRIPPEAAAFRGFDWWASLSDDNLKVESVHDGDNGHNFACEASA